MKKILIIVTMFFCLCSCGTTKYLIADISLMDSNGNTINKWENAILQASYTSIDGQQITTFNGIKNGVGFNFIDENDVAHYIVGGIIHADNMREIPTKEQKKEDSQPLIDEYNRLKKLYDEDKQNIKTMSEDNELYEITKERIKKVGNRMKEITSQLWTKYSYNTGFFEK